MIAIRFAAGGLLLAAATAVADGAGLSAPALTPGGLQLSTHQREAGYVLTVAGGPGVAIRREFNQGSTIHFNDVLPDGQYSWELQLVPRAVRRRSEAEAVAPISEVVPAAGSLEAASAYVQWGHFQIAGGAYVVPNATEEEGIR